MNVVVVGAGAVGSVLGGLLALRNHDVLLVCRRAHAEAIRKNGGLRLRSATGDYVAGVRVTEKLHRDDVGDDTVIVLTAKSYDTAACIDSLSFVPSSVPVVCFQNGIANEGIAAGAFDRVYGGVCWMTCSMIQAGTASFRRLGRLVVGRHPRGSDATGRGLVEALSETGCQAVVSKAVMNDKWLKLAVNTQSAFHAVVDPRDHESNEFYELKAGILLESKSVLKAGRLRPRSCDGKDPSIDDLVSDLRRPKAVRQVSGMNVRNSTWQNLYLKRAQMENRFFHEPLIKLARDHGVDAPFNETALQLVEAAHKGGLGPGAYRLADVLAKIDDRKKPR